MMAEGVEQPSEAHVQASMDEAGQEAKYAPATNTAEDKMLENGPNHSAGPTAVQPAASDEMAQHQENGHYESASKSSDTTDAAEVSKPADTTSSQDQRPKSKVAVIMLALCMAVFLAALDMTIISTALPTIAEDLVIGNADYTWVGSAYALACAASTPAWGKISDIFGRKPILLVANIMFLIGSLIAGLSINIRMLIAGRALQGIGGGGLLSLVNICIGDLFSMRTRGMYYGFVGMTWALASAIGPVLGGAFAQFVTWRWCFYVNLPCDGAAFLVLLFFLDIETPRTPLIDGLKAIDWLGLVLSVGGVVMFLLGLGFGGVSHPWSSPIVICLIVFGLFTLGLFFIVEWKVAKYPMMPLRLFNNISSLACFGATFCHGLVFIAGSYFLPIYFQAVIGATPILSGVYQFPFIIGLSALSAFTGIFIRKTGRFQEPIWLGMFLMTLGFGLFIDLPSSTSWVRIIIFQIIAGVGIGPNFQAPLIALQSNTKPQDMATATATFAFTRQLACSISIVIGGVIFQNRLTSYLPEALAVIPNNSLVYDIFLGSGAANAQHVRLLPEPGQETVKNAYTASLMDMWIFYTAIAFVGLLISFFIRKRVLSKTHEVRKQGLDVQERYRQEAIEEKKKKRKSGVLENGLGGTTTGSGEKVANGESALVSERV